MIFSKKNNFLTQKNTEKMGIITIWHIKKNFAKNVDGIDPREGGSMVGLGCCGRPIKNGFIFSLSTFEMRLLVCSSTLDVPI